MTDEGKANDIYEICLDRKSLCCIRQSGEDTCDKCKTYQMFKVGLEAGRPKWHDLRKNPQDLPEHSGLYCVQCGEVREYVKEEKSWFTVHFEPCLNRTEETYLWCELPKFEVEK